MDKFYIPEDVLILENEKNIQINNEQFKVDFDRCDVYFNNIQISSIHQFIKIISVYKAEKQKIYKFLCTQNCLSEYFKYVQNKQTENVYICECDPKLPMTVELTSTKAIVKKPMRIFNLQKTIQCFIVELTYKFTDSYITYSRYVC